MSLLLSYRKEITAPLADDSPNGVTTLNRAIPLAKTSNWGIRLVNYNISRYICNVHTAYQNTTMRFSFDAGTTYTTLVLPNGIYSVSAIDLAIQRMQTDLGLLLAPGDFAIRLYTNSVLARLYFEVDTNKLALVDDIIIDMSMTGAGANMAAFLGFQTTPVLTTLSGATSTHGGANVPRIDWFGDTLSLRVIAFGPISWSGASQSYEIYSVPLSGVTANDYTGPNLVQPVISCQPPEMLQSYEVQLYGTNNTPLHMLETARVGVTFELTRDWSANG